MYFEQESNSNEKKILLTIPNIQCIVQGLDVFLQNSLDVDNRIKAIGLHDELLSYSNLDKAFRSISKLILSYFQKVQQLD